MARKWSMKYKKSIDCNHPKGFSQKQHCKYGRPTKNLKKSKKYRNRNIVKL
jgi:hypothetical protein